MRRQPDCTIIPETIASKALEEDHTVGQHQSESDLQMFGLLKMSFLKYSLGLNWVSRIVEGVAHHIGERVVQFSKHLEKIKYKLVIIILQGWAAGWFWTCWGGTYTSYFIVPQRCVWWVHNNDKFHLRVGYISISIAPVKDIVFLETH